VPGEVIKLLPFGAFLRVEEGIQALVHITELAKRRVEVPEQVLQVGDRYMFEVIDIDPDRRRISLSLKQANDGTLVDTQFEPSRYGMDAETEGFDIETGEWQKGYEVQREAWEKAHAQAHARYKQHIAQICKAAETDLDH
jgi:small subunit ribosomal protein S1